MSAASDVYKRQELHGEAPSKLESEGLELFMGLTREAFVNHDAPISFIKESATAGIGGAENVRFFGLHRIVGTTGKWQSTRTVWTRLVSWRIQCGVESI